MAVAGPEIIQQLRDTVRRIERRPASRAGLLASGRTEIDRLLPGGGFPRGAISELSGGPASGKTAIALQAIAAVTCGQGLAAFVDGRHELYPPAASALGVRLDRLLILRPEGRSRDDAALACLWAAEALLASGAFELVAMDVPLEPAYAGRIAAAGVDLDRVARRLRAAAEQGGAAGLWLGVPGRRIPSAARLDLSSPERRHPTPSVAHHAA
jgi:protein ImuA